MKFDQALTLMMGGAGVGRKALPGFYYTERNGELLVWQKVGVLHQCWGARSIDGTDLFEDDWHVVMPAPRPPFHRRLVAYLCDDRYSPILLTFGMIGSIAAVSPDAKYPAWFGFIFWLVIGLILDYAIDRLNTKLKGKS